MKTEATRFSAYSSIFLSDGKCISKNIGIQLKGRSSKFIVIYYGKYKGLQYIDREQLLY